MDHQSGKIRTESHSGVFVRGLRIPPGFSPCKTHSREMVQTRILSYTSSQNMFLTARCLMSLIGFSSLNGEIGPIGTTSHEAPSVSHQGALEISSTTGQPPSLDRSHLCTPGLVAESCKRDERLRPSSQRPQYPSLSDASNEGWGDHLEQNSTQGLWSPQEKGLHINVLELKAVFLALRHFKDQSQDQTVLVATDNSTVVAYINKQGGTHSAEMCALLWRIMTWYHHFHITLKARHIPGCLNVMADLLSGSNQIQSTECHYIHKCSNRYANGGSLPTWTCLLLI